MPKLFGNGSPNTYPNRPFSPDELGVVKEKVKARTLDVANRTITKLADFDSALSSQLNPNFKSDPKWDGLFKLSLTGDDEIPINKRGSGVRRFVQLLSC